MTYRVWVSENEVLSSTLRCGEANFSTGFDGLAGTVQIELLDTPSGPDAEGFVEIVPAQ